MKNGLAQKIEYMGTDNRPREAWLTNTEDSAFGTKDSVWFVSDPGNGDQAEMPTGLLYFAQDSSILRAIPHCQGHTAPPPRPGKYIHVWFQHTRESNGEKFPDDGTLLFLDWNREPWYAIVQPVYPPYPAQPWFNLIKA